MIELRALTMAAITTSTNPTIWVTVMWSICDIPLSAIDPEMRNIENQVHLDICFFSIALENSAMNIVFVLDAME